VIYKDNMKVHLDGNSPDCCNWTMLIIQICCMICVILAPILYFATKNESLAYLSGGYLVYLILSWCTAACRYLCNVQTVPQVMVNIEAARRANPEVYLTIQCYHYETTVHKNEDGTERREERRVNTHYAR